MAVLAWLGCSLAPLALGAHIAASPCRPCPKSTAQSISLRSWLSDACAATVHTHRFLLVEMHVSPHLRFAPASSPTAVASHCHCGSSSRERTACAPQAHSKNGPQDV